MYLQLSRGLCWKGYSQDSLVSGSELDIGQVLFQDERYIELDFRERKHSMLERNGSSIEGIVYIAKS